MKMSRTCLLLSLFLGSALPTFWQSIAAPKQELIIAAASSLQNIGDELKANFEKQYPDVQLVFQWGASGMLRQQIEQGAPIDLFIAAAMPLALDLKAKGLIDAESLQILVENRLVLVVPKQKTKPKSLEDLKSSEFKRIALGESQTVPAGRYAEQWLRSNHVFEAVQSKLIPAANVKQVLHYIESRNADAGFVYATDAKASKQLEVALEAPSSAHERILYPLAIVAGSKHKALAKNFVESLHQPKVREIFVENGFTLPGVTGK